MFIFGHGHRAPTGCGFINFPRRKQIRLKNFDYTQNGAYFITICTRNREQLFGKIADGNMILSEWGKIAEEEILKTNEIRKDGNFHISYFVVMPNHIHFIAEIVGARCSVPESGFRCEAFSKPVPNSVPTVVRAYKAAVSSRIHKLCGYSEKIWQSRFFDHVIRDEVDYATIAEYIINNPKKWEDDCFC